MCVCVCVCVVVVVVVVVYISLFYFTVTLADTSCAVFYYQHIGILLSFVTPTVEQEIFANRSKM